MLLEIHTMGNVLKNGYQPSITNICFQLKKVNLVITSYLNSVEVFPPSGNLLVDITVVDF